MTQKELAALCGCTQATVSKALRGASDVSVDVRDKIMATAQKHGMIQSRVKERTGNVVLVLTSEYKSEYYANILSILSRSLWERGFEILSTTYEYDVSKLTHLRKVIGSIRGLYGIIDLTDFCNDDLNILIQTGNPIVKYAMSCPIDHVAVMQYDGIRKAIGHLLHTGHRRIAFLGELNTVRKEFLFQQALSELGAPVDNRYIHRSTFRFAQAGADGFEKLMELDEPPDAIICAYDYIALGVMNAAYTARIEVPRELAVIGMDNISISGNYRLGLTTLSPDYRKLCDTLVELLIRRVREPDAPVLQIALEYELIVRETGG